MRGKTFPLDQKHPDHFDGCMCERCYKHSYPNNGNAAIDKAIKIMELLPDIIDDLEYLLDIVDNESGDIQDRLNKIKEIVG